MTATRPASRQASLRRLRAFGVRPNRELGQNFLIDDNILDVIGRAAELDPADVVLEVGGGLGVLSEYLAARVAHLHVVEVDRSLEPPLRDALDAVRRTSTLHLGRRASRSTSPALRAARRTRSSPTSRTASRPRSC